MSLRRLIICCLCLSVLGCTDDPGPIEEPTSGLPVSPDNPIRQIEAIFNDTVRSAAKKTSAYETLFSPDVAFDCSPLWGIADSTCGYPFQPFQAQRIFEQVESGVLTTASVQIISGPPQDLMSPEPGRQGWKEVFLTNIHVRFVGPEGALELNGTQATVLVEPISNGLIWSIAEWIPHPRP